MKNNKAFTLVEVLAVIAILTLIIAIITPKIFNKISTAENITQKEQINTLINIAKIYTNQNTEKLPENNSISVITIQELKESGLINKSQILDPKTKEELTGCILIKDENNKYKYEYNEDKCNNLITVTFDPQGGQLDQTSKNVIPNETYGELPTPTREGYTFMGWNGKNLFDEKSILMAIEGATYEDGHYVFKNNKAYSKYNQLGFPITYKENTRYTMTISGYVSNSNLSVWVSYTDGSAATIINIMKSTEITNIGITSQGKTIEKIYSSYGSSADTYVSYIQLEEGSVSTPYEPYYITPTTKVVQENNHTLKAIWQAN